MDPVITSPNHSPLPWLAFLSGLIGLLWAYDGMKAFIKGARKSLPKETTFQLDTESSSENWETLCSRGGLIVESLISQFPADIATEARKVPCLFRERAEKESPGYRLMGTYHNFIPGRKSEHNGPIFIYLRSIEDFCREQNLDFEEEVRKVYLHELGHHFGWDEVDLVRHGLPSGRPPGK